jgi:ABC-type nitrate/sulfonate/bicarbonate transport system ATPase subunit
MAPANVLTVRHLSKQFAGHRVIDDLSFDMGEGERVALFAPSGSGKTTLIHILAGLEPYDSGSFTLNDTAPATVFQEPRLFPFLTVEENILLPYRVRAKPVTPAVQRRCQAWLEVCRLTECRRQYPYQLSGGMKAKVALIRGLLGEPRFVMLDEPFQSIDGASKAAIIAHLRQACPQAAWLFITHQTEDVPGMAQSVLHFPGPGLKRVSAQDVATFERHQADPTRLFMPRPAVCPG